MSMAPRWVPSNESSPVVCDLGSSTLKCGFAGDDAPRAVFPSVVGRPRHGTPRSLDPVYIGEEALSKRGVLSLRRPVEQGYISDWDSAEAVWQHAFYDLLRISPEEHPMVLTEDPSPPRHSRERMTQIMFESYSVPAMYVAVQSVLSLYSTGCTTGLVLESGHEATYAVPVCDGYSLPHAILRRHLSGQDLTWHLTSLLEDQGYPRSLVRWEAADIKETTSYVALDYERELEAAKSKTRNGNPFLEKTYKLPDGEEIALGSVSFLCPEVLFKPSLIGRECSGVHEMCHESIMKCDPCIRKDLLSNIVLSGGGTMFPGMGQRMAKEAAILADNSFRTRVIAPPDARYAAWIGGSMLASLSNFQQLWISRGEYDDFGPGIVHRKCF